MLRIACRIGYRSVTGVKKLSGRIQERYVLLWSWFSVGSEFVECLIFDRNS